MVEPPAPAGVQGCQQGGGERAPGRIRNWCEGASYKIRQHEWGAFGKNRRAGLGFTEPFLGQVKTTNLQR